MSAFTVAQISDTHLRREPTDPNDESSPDATLTRTVAFLAEHAPDLVLLTGDIADDGSTEALMRARDIISKLGVPILATPGNHDSAAAVTKVFGSATSLRLTGSTTFDAGIGYGSDGFPIGSAGYLRLNPATVPKPRVGQAPAAPGAGQNAWRILTADTAVAGKEAGRLDVHALGMRLAQDPNTPTVIALHHPPITRSTHPWFQLDGAEALVAMVATRPQVKAVVSGHLHESFHVQIGHVSYLGCPSSWYAIAHQGANWTLAKSAPVGAHILHLSHTGSLRFTLAPRPF